MTSTTYLDRAEQLGGKRLACRRWTCRVTSARIAIFTDPDGNQCRAVEPERSIMSG